MASGIGITTYSEYALSREPIAMPGWQDSTDFLVVLQSMEDMDGIFPAQQDYASLRRDIMAKLFIWSNVEFACRLVRVARGLPEYFVSKYRVPIFRSRSALYQAMYERMLHQHQPLRGWNQRRLSSEMIEAAEQEALALKREYPGVEGLWFLRLVPDVDNGEELLERTRRYMHISVDDTPYLGPAAYHTRHAFDPRLGSDTERRIERTKYYRQIEENNGQPESKDGDRSVASLLLLTQNDSRLSADAGTAAQEPERIAANDVGEDLMTTRRPSPDVLNALPPGEPTRSSDRASIHPRPTIILRLKMKSTNLGSKVIKPSQAKPAKRSRDSRSPSGLRLNLGQLAKACAERDALKSSQEHALETASNIPTIKRTVEEEFAECARAAQASTEELLMHGSRPKRSLRTNLAARS